MIVDLVFPESPSEKAGLLSGDILVSIENRKIEGLTTMQQILGRFESGKTISIEILRGAINKTVSVTLATGSDVYNLEQDKPTNKQNKSPKE